MAEKQCARKFMQDAGYGLGAENQQQYRIFWKSLWEMREAGIDRILLYCTKEFDNFCRGYPRKSENVACRYMVPWERQYRPHIELLETRVTSPRNGDLKRLVYLDDPPVANQLAISRVAWNNAINQWTNATEKSLFLQDQSRVISKEQLGTVSGHRKADEVGRDKSLFVSILPAHDGSLSVCPIIPLSDGDHLGVFAGEIRFSDHVCRINGIQGPSRKLWLDLSQVTGVLNQMKMSFSNETANVRLCWELCADDNRAGSLTSWRVSVRGTTNTKPFDRLVRVGAHVEH
jgi:hypothetical protein